MSVALCATCEKRARAPWEAVGMEVTVRLTPAPSDLCSRCLKATGDVQRVTVLSRVRPVDVLIEPPY